MLVLYTTAGCHLCEHAEALLQQASGGRRLVWQSIDIAEQDELLERYGVRIPVLSDSASGDELDWPYSIRELIAFLDNPSV